jgi:hypothetical protein
VKNIELRKQRAIDDILHYGKILEKNYEILKKNNKHLNLTSFNNSGMPNKKVLANIHFAKKDKKLHPQIAKIKLLTKRDKRSLVHQVREICKELSNLEITIQKITKAENETKCEYNVIPLSKPKIKLSYQDVCNPLIFPWNLVKVSSNFFTPYEIFIQFKTLIPNEYSFTKYILKKIPRKLKAEQPIIPPVVIDQTLYCYCRQKCQGNEFMISCEYESHGTCAFNGWFHQNCVDELKNLAKDDIEKEDFKFVCKECLKKNI